MTEDNMSTETRVVAEQWFAALDRGDIESAIACLDPNIVWINVPKIKNGSDVIPWIGTANGIQEVREQFSKRDGIAQVQLFKPISLVCDGDTAVGLVHDKTLVLATGIVFDIIFATWMQVEGGRITRWKSYCDTAPIIAAFNGIQPPAAEI
jgi:ketosteroid isomerase-like protein